MSDFDLIVVGGGPGGYVAAIRAAQLGFSTAIIEKEHLGGVCLNWGCIPTKALLHGAEVAHTIAGASHFGFNIPSVDFEIGKLVDHSRNVAHRLSSGIGYLMSKNNIEVIEGSARLVDKCQLEVDRNGDRITLSAPHIILATGARARALPNIPFNGTNIWGVREAMTPSSVPERLLIIGAGAIGVEFASFYNDIGSQVTLVEAVDRIVPVEDSEISELLQHEFRQRGIEVHTSTQVSSAQVTGDQVEVSFRQGDTEPQLTVDKVIVAVGITGNIEDLGLEALGVNTDRGFIQVDSQCRTNLVGLYAIGDVAGPPWLAHKASHEGVICVEAIAGLKPHPIEKDRVPGCTYCRPQIASVGLSEANAKARGHAVKVGRFQLSANGKALAMGTGRGLIKTILDEQTGELLGAHMIGPEVTEQIQGFGIAQQLEATAEDLAHTIFAHPTLSEAMHESVLDSLGIALHQ